MRTINDIQTEILTARSAVAELSSFEVLTSSEQTILQANSTSKVGSWRLWVWIFSFAQFIQEQYWATFKAEIEALIAQSRIHTPKWYREKALNFYYGATLVDGTDYYDERAAIDYEKVLSNAASARIMIGGYRVLRMKVVRTVNGEYAKMLPEHLDALDVYFNNHVADAGTIVIVTSSDADKLKLVLNIYYDPLQLKADGSRLDGTDATPVVTKINDFLKSIDFENGRLIISQLTDKLQQVPGVIIPVVREAYSKYGGYDYDAVGNSNVGIINEIRLADAGYMKFDVANSVINYIAYTE